MGGYSSFRVHKQSPLQIINREKDWEVGEDYQIVKQIGSGSYGMVCEAIHLPTKRKVAIKKILHLFEDKVDTKRLLREI